MAQHNSEMVIASRINPNWDPNWANFGGSKLPKQWKTDPYRGLHLSGLHLKRHRPGEQATHLLARLGQSPAPGDPASCKLALPPVLVQQSSEVRLPSLGSPCSRPLSLPEPDRYGESSSLPDTDDFLGPIHSRCHRHSESGAVRPVAPRLRGHFLGHGETKARENRRRKMSSSAAQGGNSQLTAL